MPVRVLLVGLPEVLHGILIRILGNEPDFEVRTRGDAADARRFASSARIDVVITTPKSDEELRSYAGLLLAQPDSKVLALCGGARRAELYELLPRRVPLGEISPGRLVGIIRESVNRDLRSQWPPPAPS